MHTRCHSDPQYSLTSTIQSSIIQIFETSKKNKSKYKRGHEFDMRMHVVSCRLILLHMFTLMMANSSKAKQT